MSIFTYSKDTDIQKLDVFLEERLKAEAEAEASFNEKDPKSQNLEGFGCCHGEKLKLSSDADENCILRLAQFKDDTNRFVFIDKKNKTVLVIDKDKDKDLTELQKYLKLQKIKIDFSKEISTTLSFKKDQENNIGDQIITFFIKEIVPYVSCENVEQVVFSDLAEVSQEYTDDIKDAAAVRILTVEEGLDGLEDVLQEELQGICVHGEKITVGQYTIAFSQVGSEIFPVIYDVSEKKAVILKIGLNEHSIDLTEVKKNKTFEKYLKLMRIDLSQIELSSALEGDERIEEDMSKLAYKFFTEVVAENANCTNQTNVRFVKKNGALFESTELDGYKGQLQALPVKPLTESPIKPPVTDSSVNPPVTNSTSSSSQKGLFHNVLKSIKSFFTSLASIFKMFLIDPVKGFFNKDAQRTTTVEIDDDTLNSFKQDFENAKLALYQKYSLDKDGTYYFVLKGAGDNEDVKKIIKKLNEGQHELKGSTPSSHLSNASTTAKGASLGKN